MAQAFDDPLRTLAEVLAEHGPLGEDDLTRRLRDAGEVDPDALLDEGISEITCPARQLVDDRWVWLPTVLAGRVFTHRLGPHEAAHELLTVTPDLDPITALCEHEGHGRLADGSPAQVVLAGFDDDLLEQRGIPAEVIDASGALLLAPGTLEALGVAEGDLVGVRLTEQGLAVERVSETQHAAVGARLAATLDGSGPLAEPVYFDAAVWTVCAEDPAVFTEALAPLCEIVDDFGLAHRDEWLAPGGFDFDGWFFDRECAALARRHDLDPDDAFAVYALVKLYDQMSLLLTEADADEPPEDALAAVDEGATAPDEADPEADRLPDLFGEVGAALADPLLAELFLAETVGTGRDGAAALGLFAEVVEPKAPRAARMVFRWLRAVALERVGDIDAAERELLTAESMNTDWPMTLFDLARIASDRGDAERGLALCRRAGAGPDHPLVETLTRYRAEPRRDLGRNQACWCGSGRKYKKCHLGREELALDERVGWLYAKAGQHALLSGWNVLLAAAGYERHRYDEPADDDADPLAAALDDPLVLDAVLFEGGAFAEFIQARGSLLPDDERLLAQQWLLVDRSVFEVEQVHPGQGVTVRDMRTDDTHEVRERTGSRRLQLGQLVCARVVPVGDSLQFLGGIEPVALHERDSLIALLDTGPDAVTLVAQLSRRFAPPALASTEGDPLSTPRSTATPRGRPPMTPPGVAT